MTATVKFNNKSCFSTVEICYVITNGFLSLKSYRVIS